jgi:hypothetical protein
MSLPRSVDATDLGASTVTLTTTAETLVLVGPRLQTPKETSFVVTLAFFTMTQGASTTNVVARIRSGATIAGAVVGQPFNEAVVSGGSNYAGNAFSYQQAQATDYVQNCLTVAQTAATANGTVTGATLVMMSW